MTKFQGVIYTAFAILIVIGVFIFATSRSSSTIAQRVTIWGTQDYAMMATLIDQYNLSTNTQINASYVEKRRDTFEQELVEALANQRGPDIVLLPHDLIIRHKEKFYEIPYPTYPERIFKDTFIEEGELFLTSQGVLGVPFTVDPLVLYWNRTMFSNEGIANPPKYWEEISPLVQRFTRKDTSFNINRATIALGEYDNISHAKEILSALILQAGGSITKMNGGILRSTLSESAGYAVIPAQSALSFYTQFSNPTGSFYTWNRALPNSKDMFLTGDLAMYVGFASEYDELRRRNPNLNFDITHLPQARQGNRNTTYANMNAFVILRASRYPSDAFRAISLLTSSHAIGLMSEKSILPPVRRDLLQSQPGDAARTVTYTSAIWAQGWLDPAPQRSSEVFRDVVFGVTSGRYGLYEAINRGNQALMQLISS